MKKNVSFFLEFNEKRKVFNIKIILCICICTFYPYFVNFLLFLISIKKFIN